MALVGFALAGMAHADAQVIDCEITEWRPEADWVSPRMALIVTADGSVIVIGSILNDVDQSPKQARVRQRGDTLHVSWNVSNVMDASEQLAARMS